jgi:hypothetical protein
MRHAFTPQSEMLLSLIHKNTTEQTDVFPGFFEIDVDSDMTLFELRYLYNWKWLDLTAGAGGTGKDSRTNAILAGFPSRMDRDTENQNFYVYSQIDLPHNVNLTLGASADLYQDPDQDIDQFNPKFGVMWYPTPSTTVRGAVFRTLNRPQGASTDLNPTLEPTQVAGFNQFFFGVGGEEAWRYGFGIDQKFTQSIFAGAEYSVRDLEVPLLDTSTGFPVLHRRDWDEQQVRAYVYWTPLPEVALGAQYYYEWFERDPTPPVLLGGANFAELKTHRVPLELRCFHPNGLFAGFRGTYVNQRGEFALQGSPAAPATLQPGNDIFWVFDASVGIRWPKRYGILSIDAKNLSNQKFNFQDTDPTLPRILPERQVLLRFTAQF